MFTLHNNPANMGCGARKNVADGIDRNANGILGGGEGGRVTPPAPYNALTGLFENCSRVSVHRDRDKTLN